MIVFNLGSDFVQCIEKRGLWLRHRFEVDKGAIVVIVIVFGAGPCVHLLDTGQDVVVGRWTFPVTRTKEKDKEQMLLQHTRQTPPPPWSTIGQQDGTRFILPTPCTCPISV